MISDQRENSIEKPVGADLQAMPSLPKMPVFSMNVEEMVSRLEDLVNFAMESERMPFKEDVSFIEVFKQLGEIRKAVNNLTQDQQRLLAYLSATAAEIPGMSKNLPISPENTKVFDKIKRLQDVCEEAKERIHAVLQGRPEVMDEMKMKVKDSESSEKKKKVQRKGKFRAVGGKEGWLPT
jgi:uncharacterized protein YhaN